VRRLRTETVDSIHALRAIACAWDALWRRSQATLPTARAALVCRWLGQFAADRPWQTVLVWDGSDLVAALPLVEKRRAGGVLATADTTINYWAPCGELLLEPEADEAVLDRLVEGLAASPWPMLWFDLVPIDTPRWQALAAALGRLGYAVQFTPRYEIGTVDLSESYDAYLSGRSNKLRRNLRRNRRRLKAQGEVAFRLVEQLPPSEVEPVLRRLLEVESRGWKGAAGTAVLESPGMFAFYAQVARQLAAWDQLLLAWLEIDRRPIAFEMGWSAKGVYHTFKLGYDEDFGGFGPGHLLRAELFGRLSEEGRQRAVDFQGPMNEALRAWATGAYRVGRLMAASPRPWSRLALAGYRVLGPPLRRCRELLAQGG
jgi:CelD/BcsL family acetyltransferase involved in cellulose biosynthesis